MHFIYKQHRNIKLSFNTEHTSELRDSHKKEFKVNHGYTKQNKNVSYMDKVTYIYKYSN